MKHRLEHMGRFDLICNIVISAAAILNLFPLYWMISSSLKVSQDVSKSSGLDSISSSCTKL